MRSEAQEPTYRGLAASMHNSTDDRDARRKRATYRFVDGLRCRRALPIYADGWNRIDEGAAT